MVGPIMEGLWGLSIWDSRTWISKYSWHWVVVVGSFNWTCIISPLSQCFPLMTKIHSTQSMLSLSLSLSKPNLLQMPSNLIKLGFKNINWCHFEKKYCVREAGQELDLASHNGGFVGLVWIDYGWIDWLLNKVFVVELIKIKIKWKMKNKKSIIIFLKQNFISFYFLIF